MCKLRCRSMDATTTVFAGAAKQARMLASGEITSSELLELYLERIARLDGELNAYRIREFHLARNFTAFFSSCYLGLRKPDPAIYRLALEVTQRAAEECVFIDDRPANLEDLFIKLTGRELRD